jgi:photosystem II stability/assembly factor-like uncharacterized protein
MNRKKWSKKRGPAKLFCIGAGLILSFMAQAWSASTPALAAPQWRAIGPGPFGGMFGVGFNSTNPEIMAAGVDMGNAFMTSDGAKSWTILGAMGQTPFAQPGYRGTWGVQFDPRRPNVIWIASAHGVFKSEDSGKTWALRLGGPPDFFSPIAIDPTDSDIVYTGTGYTPRFGAGWATGNLYKTLDGGKTWKDMRPGGPLAQDEIKVRNWSRIVIDPQSAFIPGVGHSRVYAVGQGGFFVSQDGGRSWSSLEAKMPGGAVNLGKAFYVSGICDLALVPNPNGQNGSSLLATFQVRKDDARESGWLGGVYRSDDGGQTWTEKNRELEAHLKTMLNNSTTTYSLIASTPADPNVLYWASPFAIWKSTDQGESWQLTTNANTEWLKLPDFDGQEVYWQLARAGGNYEKNIYGAITGLNNLAVSHSNPDYVAYTDNSGLGLSKDGGKTWDEPTFDYGEAYNPRKFGERPPMRATHKVRSRGVQLIVPHDLAVDPFDNRNIAIGYADLGLEISRDGGQWWEWAYDGVLAGERNNALSVTYDPAVRDRLYLTTGGWGKAGKLYRSDDGGKSFSIIGIPQLTEAALQKKVALNVNALVIDPLSPAARRTLYAATSIGVFRTNDGGANWAPASNGLGGEANILTLAIDPQHPRRLYCAPNPASATGLYRSDDGGENWRRIGGEQLERVRSLSLCAAQPDVLYAVAGGPEATGAYWDMTTLWRSADGGATWREVYRGRCAAVGAHPKNPNIAYVGVWAQDVTKEAVDLLRTTDGGASWQKMDAGMSFSLGHTSNKIVFDPQDSRHLFLLHSSGVYEGRDAEVPQ